MRTRTLISELVAAETLDFGTAQREIITDQILVLLEGETSVAGYRKSNAVEAVRKAAAVFIMHVGEDV